MIPASIAIICGTLVVNQTGAPSPESTESLDEWKRRLGTLEQLAESYEEKGDAERATKVRTKIVDLATQRLGANHWYVTLGTAKLKDVPRLTSLVPAEYQSLVRSRELRSLCEDLIARRQFRSAEAVIKEAISIQRHLLGTDRFEYAGLLLDHCGVQMQRNEFDNAAQTAEQAMAALERSVGRENHWYAVALGELGRSHFYMGRLQDAATAYKRSVELLEKTLGKESGQYVTVLSELGDVYNQLEEDVLCHECYVEVVESLRRSNKERWLGTALVNLASSSADLGKTDEAMKYYVEGLATIKRAVGTQHPDYAISTHHFAAFCAAAGDCNRARQLFSQCLETFNQLGMESTLRYALALEQVGRMEQDQGNLKAAEEHLLRAVEICDKLVDGVLPTKVAEVHVPLATVYCDLKKSQLADQYLSRAADVVDDRIPRGHPIYAEILEVRAKAHLLRDEADAAERCHAEALSIREKYFGNDHPRVRQEKKRFGL